MSCRTILPSSLPSLPPLFSTMCLQRRRHLRFAPWCIVSGYARACSDPRIIRDTCRLSPPSWHRFPSAGGTYPSRHWRLDRMSSTRHSRYAADSRSSYLSLSHQLCVYVCVYNTQGWSISDAFMRACTARSTTTLTGLDRYIGSITMYTVREHGSRFVRFVSRREFCSIISIRRG